MNKLAQQICLPLPFPKAETLPEDNGEGFFSKCMTVVRPITNPHDENELCVCHTCITTDKANPSPLQIVAKANNVVAPEPKKTIAIANVAAVDTNRHQAGPPLQRFNQLSSRDS